MTTALREYEEVLLTRIHGLIDALVANYINRYGDSKYENINNINFDILPGTKYYKLIMRDNGSTSVHAFISKQSGAVYKPASWKAPAKHVRYNLLDEASYETCIKKADWAGSYLYF